MTALLAAIGTAAPTVLLPLGACFIGFGGLTYHMAQFNTAVLFPERRGLVSSLYVGGFIASGVVWEIVRAIFDALGGSHTTFRAIMLVHALLAAPMIALMYWMAPSTAFTAGQTFAFDTSRLRFHVCGPPDECIAKIDLDSGQEVQHGSISDGQQACGHDADSKRSAVEAALPLPHSADIVPAGQHGTSQVPGIVGKSDHIQLSACNSPGPEQSANDASASSPAGRSHSAVLSMRYDPDTRRTDDVNLTVDKISTKKRRPIRDRYLAASGRCVLRSRAIHA
jgi:hypothetical protein